MHTQHFLVILVLLDGLGLLRGQTAPAPTEPVTMNTVVVSDVSTSSDIYRLEPVQGTYINAGKKNEVIDVGALNANIAEKTARQIFAKIPGVFVYDMDGAGNQINIAARGLDPHRGWEFNIRKDGVITNSDMFGYPASHYSMPMESIDRINLVRGTGSLQYGAQFGGMLNYVGKQADRNRPFTFETINTVGSFGLRSTYNAVGGTVGKVSYYAYYNQRVSDGYRDNAHTDSESEQVTLAFAPWENLTIKAEWARSNYTYRIPGPLTDAMFHADPTQSIRSRNYFNPDINVPSLSAELKLSDHSQIHLTSSAVIGAWNSVLFDKTPNILDVIDPVTKQPANRQVDIDHFNSYTTEVRVLQQYLLGGRYSSLAAGVQFMDNDLHRQQLGKGTTGSNFDLSLVAPGWGRDLHLKSQNVAYFVENNFKVAENLSFNAGARMENGRSNMSGTITYLADAVPNRISHNYTLLGAGLEYNLGNRQNLYAGWSQAYRPVIFKDIIPGATYDRADKNLKDANGYNLEAGYRGDWKFLKWDVGVFNVRYNHRLGKISLVDPAGNFYIYQTNIGDSVSRGAEVFVEASFPISPAVGFSLFTSTSYLVARYENARVAAGTATFNVSGNDVESAPRWMSRNGMTLKWRRVSLSMLYSYVGDSYADPLNTVAPSATSALGLVPSYGLLDVNATFKATEKLTFKVNLNNVADRQYFTKRPLFYPGPGVWPSDGRSVSVSVGWKL